MLLEVGLRNEQINTKVIDGSRGAAADILNEAKNVDAGTICPGLHGQSGVKEYIRAVSRVRF